jgi:hypothetical protein
MIPKASGRPYRVRVMPGNNYDGRIVRDIVRLGGLCVLDDQPVYGFLTDLDRDAALAGLRVIYGWASLEAEDA